MKKVILLSGSPNAEGNTVQVLKACAEVIEKNGVEAEVVSLSGMKLHDAMDFTSGDDGFDAVIQKVKKCRWLNSCRTSLLGNSPCTDDDSTAETCNGVCPAGKLLIP